MNGPASLLLPLGLIAALLVTAVLHAAPPSPGSGDLALITPFPTVEATADQSFRQPPAAVAWPTEPKKPFLASAPPTVTAPTPVPASLPTRTTDTPTPTVQPRPTKTPRPANRTGCDSAYPDENTCIPPGPPFNQGCAITLERNFTVLPPDPQRLDHDKDGIGCEPI